MQNAATSLPPGPRMPRPVQTAIWARGAQWMLAQCRRRFGDTFRLDIAYEGTWILLSNPEDVRRVFTGDPKVLHAGEANGILRPVLGDNSVLLLDDDAHMEQRKLMLPSFHGERMKRYGDLMSGIAAAEIERWPRAEPYRLRPRMQAVTLEIILRAVFGVEEGERLEQLRRQLRRLLDMITDPRRVVFLLALGPERIRRFPPFRGERERVDRLIYDLIADRRAAGELSERGDILSLLMQARHEDGSPMSDHELRDELATLLVAGHETTATAPAWGVGRLGPAPGKTH